MGVFDPKNKAKKSKMKKDALSELNSSNVNSTADSTDSGANIAANNAEVASMFDSMLLVQLLLPLTLATLLWGRKWIFSRVFLHLDKSCISLVCPSISKRERLLRWTCAQLPCNGSMQDAQLRNLWLDGRHLCTLINSVVPGACANPHRHWRRPPTHAQALAYKYLGIIPIFTEDDFQAKIMTSHLEQNFQNYLTELQAAISKISQEQEELKRSHLNTYVARGMALTTGEQHRKNFLYIYPTDFNRRYDDVIITMKGPYNTYGSIVLNKMNLLNSNLTDTSYKSSLGKKIHQQCENMERTERSFLRSLSIDLTNIMSTKIVQKEQDPFDFDIKFEKGRAKVAFITKNSGIHELCVTTNGEHISGSPFNINIERNSSGLLDSFAEETDKRVFKTVNRKVIKREIDFITEKAVTNSDVSLHNFPILEENTVSMPIEISNIDGKKNLSEQENLNIHKEKINIPEAIVDDISKEQNKTNIAEMEILSQNLLNESNGCMNKVPAELHQLVKEEESPQNNLILQVIDIPKEIDLLSQGNGVLNCSSDLSNIHLEELEDTYLSEPLSLESTSKLIIVQESNNKVSAMVRKHPSKLSSNQSIYGSSEFSTNSIEIEELQDNDLSSDEFICFGQNIFPQENNLSDMSASPKSNISVKERIAYYNKSPREIEEFTKKEYTVDLAIPMESSTFEPDILTCHTVKYTEITSYTSPIWQHIVQEENQIQNITLLNTSSEIDQESNVLTSSITSSYNTNNNDSYSSADSCLEENNNSICNIPGYQGDDLTEHPQPYYNKSSEEFSEMFRKRRQFWDKKSVENSSGCSSESSLSNPIVSSYSFYNNRRLSSEKSFDSSNNFHRSLDCFQSQQSQNLSDDDLCKSTDDLAFPSVKERKLLFIKDMNNHWSKGNTSPIKVKYQIQQKLNIPEKVIEQEVKKMEEVSPKAAVMDKIKIFDQGETKEPMLNRPELQNNTKEISSKCKDFVPIQTKKLPKSETVLSNKENFKKAQSYFQTLESGQKIKSRTEFHINQIARRHSMDCENKIKKSEAEIKAGNLTLPRVSEKFPLDNIYKDVLGDRKNTTDFKGSANKVRMIVTLHSMPDQTTRDELSVESEFKEELFFGQKKFKDRPKLNSVFPIHY